jgi:hypothetical protein
MPLSPSVGALNWLSLPAPAYPSGNGRCRSVDVSVNAEAPPPEANLWPQVSAHDDHLDLGCMGTSVPGPLGREP